MENKLQELTQKLYKVGVEKAKNEADTILSEAKKKADEIVQNANNEAKKIINQANSDSADLKQKTEKELILSSKQLKSTIKNQITNLITKDLMSSDIKESLNEIRFVQSLIELVIEKWDINDAQSTDLQIILPNAKKSDFDRYIKSKTNKLMAKGLDVHFDEEFKSGFKITPKDKSYIINFAQEDFENFFKTYLRKQTAKLLYKEE